MAAGVKWFSHTTSSEIYAVTGIEIFLVQIHLNIHLSCMKTVLACIFVFYGYVVLGQTEKQLISLNQTWRAEFGGKYYYDFVGDYQFHLDSCDKVVLQDSTENDFLLAMKQFIKEHKDVFIKKYQYNLNVSGDTYFGKSTLYATFSSLGPIPEHPRYDFISYGVSASFPGGIRYFLSLLRKEIIQNYEKTKKESMDWCKPMELYIGKDGVANFLPSNNLSNLVGEFATKKWQPSIRHGRPHAVVLSILLNEDSLFSGNVESFAYAKSENFVIKLVGKIIKISPSFDQRLPFAKTGVSLLYLPGEGYQNAKMMFGDVHAAQELISLIKAANPDPFKIFFEQENWGAKRIYFFVN